MNSINDRVKKLRKLMAERDLEAYIVLTSDPHQSEYIADHFKTREFISGFTGSSGFVCVTKDKAILWTDGRYFIQANYELQDSEFKLYKLGVEGFPSLIEFLKEEVPARSKIGLDGENVSYSLYRDLIEKLDDRLFMTEEDLIDKIWEDRPSLPSEKVFYHDIKYTGTNTKDRINKVREEMKSKGADYYLVTALDEIAYILCLRGNDIDYNPVFLSYVLIDKEKAYLYIDQTKVDDEIRSILKDNGVYIKAYDEIFKDLEELSGKELLIFDPSTANEKIISKTNQVRRLKESSIIKKFKAIKNETEIENQKNAYIKDGVALVKFLNWIETGVATGTINEWIASEKLLEFRKQGSDFIEPSFETISAYGSNAAMPHYAPSKFKHSKLTTGNFYLVDSGGQYLDGTTDITRTISLGKLTETMKKHYTLTLKSHIGLASAVWKKGQTGYFLDAFARAPLYKYMIDFNHGTGHGVGYFLNVHEGPQNISYRYSPVAIEPGMVTSIEPGIYIEGSHGIRIENIALCVEKGKNEFGEFLEFEMLSYVPLDTRPVITEMLTDEELDWLNDYNKTTYEKLSPYLTGNDLKYLEESTKKLER